MKPGIGTNPLFPHSCRAGIPSKGSTSPPRNPARSLWLPALRPLCAIARRFTSVSHSSYPGCDWSCVACSSGGAASLPFTGSGQQHREPSDGVASPITSSGRVRCLALRQRLFPGLGAGSAPSCHLQRGGCLVHGPCELARTCLIPKDQSRSCCLPDARRRVRHAGSCAGETAGTPATCHEPAPRTVRGVRTKGGQTIKIQSIPIQ